MYIEKMQRGTSARAAFISSSDLNAPDGPPPRMGELQAQGIDHPADDFSANSIAAASQHATEVEIIGLSFGAAESYSADGGYPVISDESLKSSPVDLTTQGVGPGFSRPGMLTAVYQLGKARAVHLLARMIRRTPGLIYLRARCGDQIRVPQSSVVFDEAGAAAVVLPVVGLPLEHVGIAQELWTWECRTQDQNDFLKLPLRSANSSDGLPVRIYVTAGRPINACPRESFYHVACSISGAIDAKEAEKSVWNYFTKFRNAVPMTNARHEPLNSWGDCAPGTADSVDFRERDAQSLVTLGDAGCQAWGDLLCQALAIHGISAQLKLVKPDPDLLREHKRLPGLQHKDKLGKETPFVALGMMVKSFRWSRNPGLDKPQLSENHMVECGDFKWRMNLPTEITCASWARTDVNDLGRPQNCRRNLAGHSYGLFATHIIVQVKHENGDRWYDPTFGLGPHKLLADYEHQLLGKDERDSGGIYAIIGYQISRDSYSLQNNNPSTYKYLLGATPAPKEPVLHSEDVVVQSKQ